MAPELLENWKKSEGMEKLDLKMCDVYSFGILVNELISEKKPFEGITEENFIKLKKEKPEIPKEFAGQNPLSILMKACWSDDPPSRIPFEKILDTHAGYLSKIKKNITSFSSYSDIFRVKLNKKFKEGESIEFQVFWKKLEDVFGKESEKALSFFKKLLNITEHQFKVQKKDATRICDWLTGADNKWISEGFKTSFFFDHYFGEKTADQIERDNTLKEKNSKCGVLHWDLIQNEFVASVRNQKRWEHHPLKTKTICFDVLEKEAKEWNKKSQWQPSPIFEHMRVGYSFPESYTPSGSSDPDNKDKGKVKIASIYVY